MREESEKQHDANQQDSRHAGQAGQIRQARPAFRQWAHENPAVGTEHVDGRNHDSPDGEDGGNLDGGEFENLGGGSGLSAHLGWLPNERAEENHQLGGETDEAGQTDRGHGSEAKRQTEAWSGAGDAAEFRKFQRAGSLADFPAEGEKESNGQAMAEKHERRAGEADDIESGEAEENVAHVHHARVAEHGIELALGNRDIPNIEDISGNQDEKERQEGLNRLGKDRRRDANEAVETKFFQNAGVEHRGGSRSTGVGLRRPGVEREKRDERAKSEKQEEINYRVVRNATGLGELEDMAEVETALTERLDEIETDKAKKVIDFLIKEMGVKKIRFPQTSGIGVKPVSREGTERLVRKAIQYAIDNDKPSVTLVHKGNIMKYTEGGFRDWGYALAQQEFGAKLVDGGPWCSFNNPKTGKEIIVKDAIADAFLQQILLRPNEYSVIATLNLNGDYISDALAAQVGGIGIAPGANLSDSVAMFEATHGTAPKYAGKDYVNPGSVILSAEMMLRHMGWFEAADLVISSMEKSITSKKVTYDFARLMDGATQVSCSGFGDVMIANM